MFLVFDIGGTKIRFAFSKDGQTFDGEPTVVNNPKLWKDAEPLLRDLCSSYKDVRAVCGGLPGMLDEKQERLIWSPNLPDWVGKPVKELLADATGAPVLLYNDAILSGVGEAVFGAGRGFSIVAYLTVSTGVGGSRIVGGAPDERHHGFEPGQQIIDIKTGGSLEQLISGASFRRRFGENFVRETSYNAWRDAAQILATGIHNTIVYWSPDVVVLGGPMVLKTPGIPFVTVQEELKKLTTSFPDVPPLFLAELGDQNGLRGAVALLVESLKT